VSKNEAINRLRDELNRLAEVVNDQDAALIDECLNEAMELAKPPADTIPVRVAVAMAVMENGEIAGDVACNLGVCEIEETAKDRVSVIEHAEKVVILTAHVKPPTTEVEIVDAEVSDA
jgi:hypothetical protein